MNEKTDKALVEETIRRRIKGIHGKDSSMISSAIKVDVYTKFDDWIGRLQRGSDALKEEEAALKVLSRYSYNITDLKVEVKGDFAWASFYLYYEGVIRNRIFNVQSRVSMVLVKEDVWRIVHEHFSVMPKEYPIRPLREEIQEEKSEESIEERKPIKTQIEKAALTRLDEAVLSILREGEERSAIEIAEKILVLEGKKIDVAGVVDSCHKLVNMNLIEQSKGGLYPRYRIKLKQ